MVAIKPADLFGDANSSEERTERFEDFKSSLNKSFSRPLPAVANPDQLRVRKAVADGDLSKSVSGSVLNSLESQLSGSFLGKDLDLAGPGTTGGLAQYDLEAPSKKLVPVTTPIRNRLPRLRGQGTAHEFKRLLGYSGSGTGGVGQFFPGQEEGDTVAFGSMNLHRGKIIEYAGDHLTVPFKKYTVSDRASFDAFYAGTGYENIRQLSTTSALRSAMILEEKMLLQARGTASGFAGALATPSAPTVTTPTPTGDQTATTGISGANCYVLICATTLWGRTALSAAGTSAFTSGDVVTISWSHVEGATGYEIYLGQGSSAPASSAMFLQAVTAGNSITLEGPIKTSGDTASGVDGSKPTAFSTGYDGIITILMDPDRTGYLGYQNGPVTIGAFQDAFAAMYNNVQANPDTIYLNGVDRLALSNLLTNQSSTNYMITIENTPGGPNAGTIGAIASSMTNGLTGKVLELEHHPYIPRGVAPILSWNIPTPDSNIPDAWAVCNSTDYMSIEWPQIEFYFDVSVYWRGTFCAYAPAWSGCIAGITG